MNVLEDVRRRAYFIWLNNGSTDNAQNFLQAIRNEFGENEHICSICLDRCDDPYILTCGHFNCKECLKDWVTNYKKNCPYCNKVVKIENLAS